MFSKNFYQNLGASIALLAFAAAMLMIAPKVKADEQKWSKTSYCTAKSAYVFQDFAIYASEDPVLQCGVTFAKDGFSVDLWQSVGLQGDGKFGQRGASDEFDLTFAYADTVGPLNCELVGAYYALALPSMGQTRDDMLDLHADCTYPWKVGDVGINPYGRLTKLISLGTIPGDTLIRVGFRPEIKLTDDLSLKFDTGLVFHVEDDGYEVWRNTATLNLDIGDGWSAKVGAEFATKDGDTVSAGIIGVAYSWE